MKSNYIVTASLLVGLLGCASIDSSQVRARAGAPESARVDRLEIPYDASLPKYALIIETFVNSGPVSQTSIRSHQFINQNGKNTSSSESKASLTGSGRETIQAMETTQVDSQNKALLMGPPSGAESSAARHPMIKNVSASDTPESLLAARSKESSTLKRDEKYGREASSELTGRGTTTTHGRQYATQHTDSAVEITQRSWEASRRDVNVAAQLTSSLSGVGNFVILSPAAGKSVGGGVYQANLPSGALGPFIVKAIITEEVYEVEGGRLKIFIPGVVSSKRSELKGVVIIDITVLDGRNGALVTAFPSEGTFISQDKRFSAGIVVPLAEQHAFARSVASQAQRVALNQATERILEALRNHHN